MQSDDMIGGIAVGGMEEIEGRACFHRGAFGHVLVSSIPAGTPNPSKVVVNVVIGQWRQNEAPYLWVGETNQRRAQAPLANWNEFDPFNGVDPCDVLRSSQTRCSHRPVESFLKAKFCEIQIEAGMNVKLAFRYSSLTVLA